MKDGECIAILKNRHQLRVSINITTNDAALLTCISNDYGYENVFRKPVEMFADEGDVLIATSSSGKSENILNGTLAARKLGGACGDSFGVQAGQPPSFNGRLQFFRTG